MSISLAMTIIIMIEASARLIRTRTIMAATIKAKGDRRP